MNEHIEIHEAEEWAAVYLNGVLQRVGDAYLVDEWLREHFGVVTVIDDAFMRGQTKRDGVARTLDEVAEYATARDERLERARRLCEEADRLSTEADQLTRGETA